MDLAKDIVQDAFEVLWNKRNEIAPEKARQFLFTVVYRKGMDVFRKEKYDTDISAYEESLVMTANAEQAFSDKELLHAALTRLPELHKQLILLRDLEGYSYEEIGEITGLNESQVKVYLFRARKSLKETITQLEAL